MRPTRQLYATVKSASKYLEPNTPTGLTGLTTHPCPRPALLLTYYQTLQRLKSLPASSVYRQSTEALTKHRMSIIEATKPAGYDEWHARVSKVIDSNPEYQKYRNSEGRIVHEEAPNREIMSWDGEVTKKDARREGSNTQAEAEQKGAHVQADVRKVDAEVKEGAKATVADLEQEPPLTAEQINEVENKIGAGLIEEVIQVAQGELKLVDEMLSSRAWEDLEEKAPPGQWEYFDRGDRV